MNDTTRFPLGAAVRLDDLGRDPYPILRALRESEPVSWVPCVNAWFVTRHDDVCAVLADSHTFATEYADSLLMQVFGSQILSVDGAQHDRYRAPLQRHFTPQVVRERMGGIVRQLAELLIDSFAASGTTELRRSFASRLPIQVILSYFGLPLSMEQSFRGWYDAFEAGLANFSRDPSVEASARAAAVQFYGLLRPEVARAAGEPHCEALLACWVQDPAAATLSHDEILRNALTVFFGGISTVEALLLNTVWALATHAQVRASLIANPERLSKVIEEVMRWIAPVQTAARQVRKDTVLRGVKLAAGETVSCMLGAANRDPEVFPEPDIFNIDRVNLRKHVGFSGGAHFCLGSHLARLEAVTGVGVLLQRLPGLMLDPRAVIRVEGYEFRQPRSLPVLWEKVVV